jgi:hypothetical protein
MLTVLTLFQQPSKSDSSTTALRRKPTEAIMAKATKINHWEGYSVQEIIDTAAKLSAEASLIAEKLDQAKEMIRELGKDQSHIGNLFIAVVGKDSIGFRIDRKRIEAEMGKDWVEDHMEGYTSAARITFAPAPVQ